MLPSIILNDAANLAHFHLFFTTFFCFINNLLLLALTFQINSIPLYLKNTWGLILGILVITFTAKLLLSFPWYELTIAMIFTVYLKRIMKIGFWKSLLSVSSIIIISKLGVLILEQPIILNQPGLWKLFLKISWKNEFKLLLEMLLLINFKFGLYILGSPLVKLRNTPIPIKIAKISIMTFNFFLFYYLIMLGIWSLHNTIYPKLIVRFISEIILFAICIMASWCIIKNLQKKHLEEHQIQTYSNQSYQLTETLFSERREYRNQLQVINFMATAGNNINIINYINKIVENMSTTGLSNIRNPILRSVIMTRQVHANEKGVKIVINCDNQLPDIPFNVLKLAQILETLLDLFVEIELNSKSISRCVFLDINEYQNEYFFEFKSSAFSILQLHNTPNSNAHSTLSKTIPEKKELEHIIKLIQEMRGETSYTIDNNQLVCFYWIIKKPKSGILGLVQVLTSNYWL